MLSNNGLCLRAAVQYVLLFLVRFSNSDWFQIYGVTRSYHSRLFLRTLVLSPDHPSADATTVFQCDDVCSCYMSNCVVCVGSKAVDCLMASKWTSKPPEEDEYSPYFVTRSDAVKYCFT